MMRLGYRSTIWVLALLLIGCGAAYQSESTGARQAIDDGNSYFKQGNVYLKKKKYHKAIEQYQQALRLDPDAAIIHAALGWAYYKVGMLDAAIAEGEEVMRLEPNHPDVPKLMELLYQERDRRR
ncbi:MAG: tetratricopeptide repeat protein [Candidatus Poribacteria bacterium]|nr:tetratricopeptide repeat protein [Candidatus Poribacteria bacterium]